FGSITENVGETRNRGIEVPLSTISLDGWHGIRRPSDISRTANRNALVRRYGRPEDARGSNWFAREPIHVLFDYEQIGLRQRDEAAEAAAFDREPGDVKVRDLDGNGRIDANDYTFLGNHTNFPKWTGSFANRFEYGAFDLSALAYARWGYTVRSDVWPGQMS